MQNTGRLRRIILVVAGLILLMQGVATWRQTERARDAQLAGAEESVARIARGMEGAANRAFVQVDSLLAGLPAILAAFLRDGTLRIADVNRVLRELNNQNLMYRDILLVGRGGVPVAAAQPLSRRRPPPVDAETAFSDLGAPGGSVLIAGPVLNPVTGEWSIFLARNVTVQGLGPVLAMAEVPVQQIQSLLSVGAEGPGLRLTLERDDGTLLASLPHDETRMGRRLSPSAAQLLGPGVREEIAGRFTGRPVLIAVRPTLYPTLLVSASLETEAALAVWRRDSRTALLLSGALAVLVLTVALALNEWLRHRDRVETERAQARQMLENAIESMTDGFVMFDAGDRLVACNSRYRDFYHISASVIMPGARFEDIMREGARRGQYVGIAGDELEAWVQEMVIWHRGNHPPMERLLSDGRWLRITERRMPDGGTVGIRTDITPMKRAMAALSAARDEAAQAAEAKSRFLARMSHELRTPLNGVLGFAQVLLNDARLTTDQRQQVRTLHDAGRHLLQLVNGLLDLSKIEAGRLELAPEATPLQPLLEGCTAFLRPEIERKAIGFALEVEPGLPAAVEADPTRLRQLLLNLLSNAVKFTPAEGRVTLRACRLPHGSLRFEVEDTGPGVPPEKRHLLFDDFVQLGTLTPEETMGTGLGLAISARLAALMGGRIGCGDGAAGGALFWVELPLRAAVVNAAGAPPPPDATGIASAPRLSILVVDDVKANRDVALAMLEGAGHRVTLAGDAQAGIAALQRQAFDVVLMDIHMPGMDGLEATRRIRALPPPVCAVPVIALTASVQPEQVEACRAAGMDGHLDKPLDRQRLLAVLAGCATNRTDQASREPTPAAAPLLDGDALADLERQLGGAAAGIVAEFVSELRRTATLLADATPEERADASRVKALAHRLLGGARTLGAPALVADAEALQRAAREGEAAPGLQARAIATASATLAALEARDAPPASQAA